jgi:Rad3-related DNA helicase
MVGLPFPNLMSAEMIAKRDFIQNQVITNGGTKEQSLEAAKDFYENLCLRAVNQSIGRAIRHANDYASIILIDQRYNSDRIQKKLPAWIRKNSPDRLTMHPSQKLSNQLPPSLKLNNTNSFPVSLNCWFLEASPQTPWSASPKLGQLNPFVKN